MDEIRARYLRDRVMTATPAQRVVMLYDRLSLDLTLAAGSTEDLAVAGGHIGHASLVVGELFGSLNMAAGGPSDNLAAIYGYLLKELMRLRTTGEYGRLPALSSIVSTLRTAWVSVAEQMSSAVSPAPLPATTGAALVSAWVS